MSRVSAKRMLVAAAGLALALALTLAAIQEGDSAFARLLGPTSLEWAIPLTVGAVVGFSAWMLLDGSAPEPPESLYAETVCPSCGRTVLQDWRLCPHCGAFIAADAEQPAERRRLG